MQILDLFSGIGGFSLGFESANFKDYDFNKLPSEQKSVNDGFFKTAAFCEIDTNCHKILKKHWADVPIFHDVTKITSDDLAPLGKIEIITGGFPCQDLSCAGKRIGFNGTRSTLFSEILRLARITNARFILFENSSELITNKAYFKVFTQELRECGFNYRAFLLRASAYGYMHERKRAYVIAYSDKVGRFCDETLFYEVSNANTQEPSKEIISLRDRYFWREANGYKNDLRDIRADDGFCQNVERVGMLGNSIIPEIAARFARFIKRI
ncbi:DNA (cytosine-5-)-methyltransferase [Campylobacter gastrosuis]|uniref:Cytosine-specific methyltransferase n=1 Tax=Campylobacter gastrosuis TaxID=2974576 RepID=A0ABT7HT70_9BACT|nr:DNA (cytosine-5-)-methyltransferase [Campylobacter gastrosuis]MDL0090054.1 DNA (cytosine-5-)-methyltransferase [Campylobacter gastrosuis]